MCDRNTVVLTEGGNYTLIIELKNYVYISNRENHTQEIRVHLQISVKEKNAIFVSDVS